MLIAICDDDKRICSILNLFGVIAFFAVMTVIHSYQQVKKAREESLQNALVSKQVEELPARRTQGGFRIPVAEG